MVARISARVSRYRRQPGQCSGEEVVELEVVEVLRSMPPHSGQNRHFGLYHTLVLILVN
jgi:hypothetical protein